MKHLLTKGLVALTVLAALLAAASCKSKSAASGPEKAAKEAVAAIQKGDYDAYAATFDMSESEQKMLAGMIEEKAKEQIDAKGGIKGCDILESSLNEAQDQATVKVQINYGDGSQDTQSLDFVKKEDGSWKQKLVK
jgi:hypothetical protein